MPAARARLLPFVIGSMLVVGDGFPRAEPCKRAPRPDTHSASTALAKMPIRFEANAGQHDGSIRFVARRGAAALALRDDGATLVVQQRKGPKRHGDMEQRANRVARPASPLRGSRSALGGSAPTVDQSLVVVGFKVDGGRQVAPQATAELATKTSYFIGSDHSKWRTNIPSYAKVTYPSVLDGVDLVYHGESGALEYDFVVGPGANVDSVAMNVEGANKMSITESGELRINTYAGDIVQPPPVVYQHDGSGAKRTIASRYRLIGRSKLGFEVSSYDRTKPLVIDPVIGYATYLGGTGYDSVTSIAADAAGNTYVTGTTYSTDFPTANAYDPTFNVYDGCPQCPFGTDTFVAKLSSDGSQLAYATFIGGTSSDDPTGIAVGADGTAYVTGTTSSNNFPLVNPVNQHRFNQDGFVARLGAGGDTLAYSTYLSGGGDDAPAGIAVDASGIYIGGNTTSTDLTEAAAGGDSAGTHGGASGGEDNDAFIVKLTPLGNVVSYVKYLGGGQDEITAGLVLDSTGRPYIAGYTYSGDFPQGASPLKRACQGEGHTDVFVARLDNAGSAFDYASCFGGSADESAYGLAVDSNGNLHVTGQTFSADFPTLGSTSPHAGSADAFVTKLNPGGNAMVYSRLIGGVDYDVANDIAIDSSNSAWITGATRSNDFPTVAPVQAANAGGGESGFDAFVTRLNASGTALLFSTFYGGGTDYDEGTSIATNGATVHLGGNTYSTDLPLVNARQQTNAGEQDAFLAQISIPPLLIAPPSHSLKVGESQQFDAVGGAGFGYFFTFQTNGSGGSISSNGLYSAGNTGDTVDEVLVTDGAGTTASATVHVRPNDTTIPSVLTLSPTGTSLPPRGHHAFTAAGGVPPYTFGLASNASGGTLTSNGSYTAGSKGNVTDIVRVMDSVGASAQSTINVGASLAITPAKPATPPHGSISFAATGGSGSGYAWTIAKNGSGAILFSTNGQYTAGGGTNTVDTVQVSDSLGNNAQVNVSVGGGLAVAPADPSTSTRGTIEFSAFGGSGVFSWSLISAPSGATIEAASGAYVAGSIGNTIDTVRVQDTVGNTSTVLVSVGPSLTITPQTATVVARAPIAFSAQGGSGAGYTFTLKQNQTGASLADGYYTAGSTAGSDVIHLADSLGNTADATITVATTTDPGNKLPDGGVPPTFDAGTFDGLNLGGSGINEDCGCRAVGSASTGSAPTLAALILGLVVRRRRRRA